MDNILLEIKDALKSNELFGIPIGGDFNELLTRPEFSEPLKIEKNNYDYGRFEIERYGDVILIVRMRPEKEVALSNIVEIFGEGEASRTSQYEFRAYSSEKVYIVFTFELDTGILERVNVASTIFMD